MEEHLIKVLEQIKPTNEEYEEMDDVFLEVRHDLVIYLNAPGADYHDIIAVGSFAKNTILKENSDIDIFIRFNKTMHSEEFEDWIIPWLKKCLDGDEKEYTTELNYASHPYLSCTFKGYKIDIVPCFFIETIDEMLSAVDRTPLHTQFVKNSIILTNMADEIRLLKQFMKHNNLYGANESVKGFSGYLCECLVIRYGSFEKVLENELKEFVNSRTHPIWFPDPVDSHRNVGAALSVQKFNEFRTIARWYLYDKDCGDSTYLISEYFLGEKEPMSFREIKKEVDDRETKFLVLEDRIIGNEEIAISKFRKYVYNKLYQTRHFEPIRQIIFQAKPHNYAIIEYRFEELPKTRLVTGPKVSMKQACYNFMKAHVNVYVDEDKLVAVEPNNTNVLVYMFDDEGCSGGYDINYIDSCGRDSDRDLFKVRQELTKMLKGIKA